MIYINTILLKMKTEMMHHRTTGRRRRQSASWSSFICTLIVVWLTRNAVFQPRTGYQLEKSRGQTRVGHAWQTRISRWLQEIQFAQLHLLVNNYDCFTIMIDQLGNRSIRQEWLKWSRSNKKLEAGSIFRNECAGLDSRQLIKRNLTHLTALSLLLFQYSPLKIKWDDCRTWVCSQMKSESELLWMSNSVVTQSGCKNDFHSWKRWYDLIHSCLSAIQIVISHG